MNILRSSTPENGSRGKLRLLILICFSFFLLTFQLAAAENATITSRVKWKYGGYIFTTDLSFKSSDYRYYKSFSKTWSNAKYANEDANHKYLVSLAAQLDEDASQLGYSGYQLVEYLTAFVQQGIAYKKDPYNNGYDYPKYPIETVAEKSGDCEDKAALLVALLNTFGFDAVMVRLPGHMAAAVRTNGAGSYYFHKNKKYSFIETTGIWKIGSIPSKYQKTGATIIDVSRPDRFVRGASQNRVLKSGNPAAQTLGCEVTDATKSKSAVLKTSKEKANDCREILDDHAGSFFSPEIQCIANLLSGV